jgi:hypothetical protein
LDSIETARQKKLRINNIIIRNRNRNCNTELAMLRTLDFITSSLNAGTPSIGLFVDISKAFDSINHAILLDKLLCLGFRGVVYSWLSSYLSQRFQYVEVNGVKSSLSKISSGVPQGSILGPLLFLICINDISNISDKFHITSFADDTTVLFSDPRLKYSISEAEIYFTLLILCFLCETFICFYFLVNDVALLFSGSSFKLSEINLVELYYSITVCY